MIKKKKRDLTPSQLVGWQEWCQLDELGLPLIKAKVDTGAKTSSIHAIHIDPFVRDGKDLVRFVVHPLQRTHKIQKVCEAPLVDFRDVKSSTGHRESRYVIHTPITLGGQTWEIEITLTDRRTMRFRMLIGRDALKSRILVDPSRLFLNGKYSAQHVRALYEGSEL